MHATGKKPLDAEINVVPFIDLMAVTIAFLLITAVWSQAGAVPVAQSGGHGERADEEAIHLRLKVSRATVSGALHRAVLSPIPLSGLGELEKALRVVKENVPLHRSVSLQVDDDVRYEDLVRVIDVCRGVGLDDVSVSEG